MYLNQWTLIGRLTADPELSYTPTGKAVAKCRIAINMGQDRTEFHSVVLWDKTAEFVGTYGVKGRLLLVEGRAQTRQWEVDGQKRQATECVGHNARFLDAAKKKEGAGDEA